jgi:hypothetical protein
MRCAGHWRWGPTAPVEAVERLPVARFPQRSAQDQSAAWQHAHCNRLKHDPGVLDALIAEAAQLSRRTPLSQKAREDA